METKKGALAVKFKLYMIVMVQMVAPQFVLNGQVVATQFVKQDNSVIMVTNLAANRIV